MELHLWIHRVGAVGDPGHDRARALDRPRGNSGRPFRRPTAAVVALGITWELRIAGVWRVFYSVDSEIMTVDVIHIARKGRETTEQLLAAAEEDGETDT